VKKNEIFLGMVLLLCLTGCSDKKKPVGQYPIIDIINSIGKYQRVYMSDLFSSIELIPLETNKNSLVGGSPGILANDSLIFINSVYSPQFPPSRNLLVFDRAGKFLNQIGQIGRGPGEYFSLMKVFLNSDRPTIFIDGFTHIFEYDFTGKFIHSFPTPRLTVDGNIFTRISYYEDGLFVGFFNYSSNSTEYHHCFFDRNGDIVKCSPSLFYMRAAGENNLWMRAMAPFRVGEHFYIRDHINDTLYTLINSNLQPAYVFDLGKYSYPLGKTNAEGKIEIPSVDPFVADGRYINIYQLIGSPNYFFYKIRVPFKNPVPKSRPVYSDASNSYVTTDGIIFGIYNIAENINMLLDTDLHHHQKGLINDINGGLSFFPRYYSGNGKVVDIWQAEDMLELLTEEYFASIKIKDPQAHQKLRDLLKTLGEEDNPVVVIAKLK